MKALCAWGGGSERQPAQRHPLWGCRLPGKRREWNKREFGQKAAGEVVLSIGLGLWLRRIGVNLQQPILLGPVLLF